MIYDYDPDDHDFILRQLRVDKMPTGIFAEYVIRRQMLASCGGGGGLGAERIMEMLRHLDMKPPEVFDGDTQVEWRTLERGTELVVEQPNKEPWVGLYDGPIDMGTVGVKPKVGETDRVVEVRKLEVRVWHGEPLGVHLDSAEAIEAMKPFHDLPLGSRVEVKLKGKTTVGKYRGKASNGKISVQVDTGQLLHYGPKSVTILETAEV